MEFLLMAIPQDTLYDKWDVVAVNPDGFEWGKRDFR